MTAERRQIAEQEVGHTSVASWLSKVLTAVFLATIALPSTLQVVRDLTQWQRGIGFGADYFYFLVRQVFANGFSAPLHTVIA